MLYGEIQGRYYIKAICPVPDGADENYGYLTLKEAIVNALDEAHIEIPELHFWYDDNEGHLTADAKKGKVRYEIEADDIYLHN